jgi:hypothetical protein
MRLPQRFPSPLAAALVWAAWVMAHSFVVPEEKFFFSAVPLDAFPFWQAAVVRTLRAVSGFALLCVCGWGVGAVAIAPIRNLFTEKSERAVFQLALGFAVLSYALLAFAAVHLYRPGIVRALLVIGAVVGATTVAVRRVPDDPPPVRSSRTAADLGYTLLICVGLGFALIGALAPETEYDALWYHLWLPLRWLDAGRPVDIVEEYVSLYPLTWELLYGAATTVGGPIAAKLLHFACLPLLAVGTSLLTRRLFPNASATLAAALVVTTPIALYEATTAYVDLALTLYVTLAIYAVVRHQATADRRWLFVAGVMIGVASAIKHLGLIVLTIVGGGVAVREAVRRSSVRRALRVALPFVGVGLLIPLPWYVRAAVASGNPVFPDFYRTFGASPPERWSEGTELALQRFKDHFGGPRTPANLARLPWDMTVHAARYGGTLGPAFLILIPAALVRRRPSRAAVSVAGVCIAYLGFWASPWSSLQMRFILAIVPLLAALAAEGAATIGRSAEAGGISKARGGSLALAALLTLNLPPFVEWHEPDRPALTGWLTHVIRGVPLAVVSGAESDSSYLARSVPSYRAWQYINANVSLDSRVLTFSGGDQLYSARPRIWSDSAAANDITWSAQPGEEAMALAAARRLGVTHVLMDKRLVEAGGARSLAIASDTMRACCLVEQYEDDRFVLYRISEDADERRSVDTNHARP